MHEYAVIKDTLEIVLEEAAKANAKEVLEIRLAIGELSLFEESSIRMYFDILGKDTIAQEAKISIRTIDAQMHCGECEIDFSAAANDYLCPQCGRAGKLLHTGNDFYIESIEIE